MTGEEIRWLLATPLQQPADAGYIAWLAGTGDGRAFAIFARREPSLFQRLRDTSDVKWTYRLSEAGADLCRQLEQSP